MASSGNLLKLRLGRSAIQAATTAWVDAVLAAGSTVSPTQRSLINQFFRSVNDAGVLALADDMWMRCTENATQASISLLDFRTVTGVNSPAFIKWRGVAYNGIDQYDDSGFIPSVHAVQMTGTSMRVAVREQTNAASLAAAVGSYRDAVRNTDLYPRTGISQIAADLSSTIVTGPANTDSRRLIGAQRESTTYTFDVAGIDVGTASPATPGSSLSTVTTFFGARNVNGTPDGFRLSISAFVYMGAPLSAAQKLALSDAVETYLAAALALVDLNVYVSSVNYGGIPVGSDSNAGTSAAPLLTISRGLFGLPPVGTLHLNGNPAAPPTYAATSEILLSEAGTIEAINSRGATIAGYGTTRIMQIGPTAGETVTLNKAIFDGTLNTVGAATYGIELLTQTVPYAVALSDAQLQGQAATGYLIRNTTNDLAVDLTLTDCELIGGNTRGNIDLRALKGTSSLTVVGGTSLITNANNSGYGAIIFSANEAGATASMTNHDVDVTVDAAFVGTTAYGCVFTNVPTVIDGGTFNLTSPNVGSAPNGYPLAVSQGRITDTYQLPIDGSVIRNAVATNTCYGGALFRLGDDNADKTLAADCEIYSCTGEGDANFAAAGGHSLWIVNCTRPRLGRLGAVEANIGGIGLVDKSNVDGIFENFTIRRHTSSYILNKASINSIYRDFFVYAYAGYAGSGINYSVGDNNDLGVYGTGSFTNGRFENVSAVNFRFINVDVGFGFSITGCHFEQTGGSLNAAPFVTPLGSFATFAAFNAVYPGNTANFA